jgi:2-pyrone-4,6-dicarboxylate lactonase
VTVAVAGPDPHPEPIVAPAPPGACDCHAHIFGPSDRFPYAEGRGYTPPDVPLEAFLRHLDRLGLERGVVVQGNAPDAAARRKILVENPARLYRFS